MTTLQDEQTNSAPVDHKKPPALTELVGHLRRPGVLLPLLSAFTFLLYYATLSFEFVWDDWAQVVNNALIRSWHGISKIFITDLWFHDTRSQIFYRPLFVIWSVLNFKIFGLKAWGWHLSTVLLHVGATLAVYWLARSLKLEHWTAAVAALIFGFHPAHIEPVAWISAGSDSMVTAFYMLAFSCFLKAREPENSYRRSWQVASYLLLVCALLTKEMAVTFTAMVMLYEWLVITKQSAFGLWSRVRRALIAGLPYMVITAVYLWIRDIAIHRKTFLDTYYTNLQMVMTWPVVLANYLRILLFPKGLTGLYDVPYVVHPGLWNFAVPIVALLAAAAVVFYWKRRSGDSRITFLALWMLICLTPTMCLRVFGPGCGVRDRYIYLSSVGFALLAAMAIRSIPTPAKLARRGSVQWPIVAVLAVAYGCGTLSQEIYWGNDLLVFYRGHSLFPNSTYITDNLALALIERGANERAIALLEDAIRRNPSYFLSYYRLALAYSRVGQKEEARKALHTALAIGDPLSSSEIGYTDLGAIMGELGDYESALRIYESVLARDPDLYVALYNSGFAYFALGKDTEAEKFFRRASEVSPDLAPPVYFLGRIRLKEGQPALAEVFFRKALAMNSTGYSYHYWLGEALAAEKQPEMAKQEYQKELQINPGNTNAMARLSEAGAAQNSSSPAQLQR